MVVSFHLLKVVLERLRLCTRCQQVSGSDGKGSGAGKVDIEGAALAACLQ